MATLTTKDSVRLSPLREPGQSLRDRIADRLHDGVMLWVVLVLFSCMYCGLEWARWYFAMSPSPIAATIVAVATSVIASYRIKKGPQEIDLLSRGLKGEQYVGQLLQSELMPKGYYVIHDLVCENFNIDHVIIGPAGVFSVETNLRFKPASGRPVIGSDGRNVLVDGCKPDRDPVAQAKACARRVKEILKEYSGKDVYVDGVVIFPGWFVRKVSKSADNAVMNDKQFVKFVEGLPARLDTQTCELLMASLSRYVRSQMSTT